MFQGSHCEKSGVLHDHFVVLHHIQKCHDQFGILNRDDLIHIFLDIWEDMVTGAFYCSTVCDGVDSV